MFDRGHPYRVQITSYTESSIADIVVPAPSYYSQRAVPDGNDDTESLWIAASSCADAFGLHLHLSWLGPTYWPRPNPS
jgi:hypothetical protein